VFFPKNSYIFLTACDEGIYENEVLRHIQTAVNAGSWYFDVGANIGLPSVPVLRSCTYVNVLSCGPSPNSRPYLFKTWENCRWKSWWKIIEKAVGDRSESSHMSLPPPQLRAYDCIKHTHRVKRSGVVDCGTLTTQLERVET
jgi:FkbM family methyltransferase